MSSADVVVGIVLRPRASADVVCAVLRQPCSRVPVPSADVVVGIGPRPADVVREVLREPGSWVPLSSADVVVGIVLRLRASADMVRAVLREAVLMGSRALG
ncbi:hypothetical protein [Nocardia abscessus]|uniref:hypothetical protein n=1 Tax=Nocardia abscessus TaxID=120957 RepID=UPI0012F98B08|nr:hypothetical protein [Nocardia abscessus]MCC3329879.1 hypothetical protein [Nocardia abscessus]